MFELLQICGASAEVLLFVLAAANTWKVFNCCMGEKKQMCFASVVLSKSP
jgi:hypothetical protein